jgi:hypothetical protein
MASERQIAANRRNARNSTGPRSISGKKRASQNAFRHGLTKPISGAAFDREVETLARQIAGDSEDKITIERARDAAEAELELARVRRVKVALIERASAFGSFDVPECFACPQHEAARIMQHFFDATLSKGRLALDVLPMIPSQEPQRMAEAVCRILPELIKLRRYESRAVMRRDRAIRAVALRCKLSTIQL